MFTAISTPSPIRAISNAPPDEMRPRPAAPTSHDRQADTLGRSRERGRAR